MVTRKVFLTAVCTAIGSLLWSSAAVGQCRIDFGATLNDFGVVDVNGDPLDTQHVFTNSIVFGAAVDSARPDTIVANNGACPSDPRSSGVPIFKTDWWAQFKSGTAPGVPGPPAFVTTFSADICSIDGPQGFPGAVGVTLLEAYDNDKNLIASTNSTMLGLERMTVTAPPGGHIQYVRVVSTNDAFGLSIDCLDYDGPFEKSVVVPALTGWGMAALLMVLLAGITIKIRRLVVRA